MFYPLKQPNLMFLNSLIFITPIDKKLFVDQAQFAF